MKLIIVWLYTLALAFAPVDKARTWPGHEESPEDRRARYMEIATDIAAVAFDESERPIWGMGRVQTAAMLLALAIGESNLDPDVDGGPCYRGGAYRSRCDYGRAFSIWQIMIGKGRTPEGWTGAQLNADRQKAARTALHTARASWWSCRRRPDEHRLALYAAGRCDRGHKGSAARVKLWRKLMAAKPLPKPPDKPSQANDKSAF